MAVSDYFVNLGDPFERSINAFRGGYSDAKAMVGDAERRDERARLVEARQAGTAAMQSLAALGGNATAQDYRVAAAANPEMAAAIQAQGKLVGSERSANDLRAAQGLFVALASPDAGEVIPAQLEKRIAAAEASGDKQTADAARAMLLTYGKPGGANALRVALGVSLSGGMPAGQFNYLVGEVYPKADRRHEGPLRASKAGRINRGHRGVQSVHAYRKNRGGSRTRVRSKKSSRESCPRCQRWIDPAVGT